MLLIVLIYITPQTIIIQFDASFNIKNSVFNASFNALKIAIYVIKDYAFQNVKKDMSLLIIVVSLFVMIKLSQKEEDCDGNFYPYPYDG
ncbi:unnamed protein product [Paramecium sonneborni]|uniref:Uncharacterized protein n=1 Tax=Paramecium sonneborni TaxID=65129 RepID=A0A8S1RSV0_9CILI|nr:unnamed protein product [Paramecium sonneborni]